MKRCPFCAERMQYIAIVCPHCGRDYPRSGEFSELEMSTASEETAPRLSTKRIWIFGLLIIAIAASGWLFMLIQGNNSKIEEESFRAAMATQSVQLANNKVEIANLSATRAAGEKLISQEMTIRTTLEAASTQQAQVSEDQRKELAFAQSQQVRLCKEGEGLEWDYTNNETIFAQLKTFSEGLGGKVEKSTYTLPWNISNLAVYTINTKYVFWFIVYFQQEDLGFTNSIYWVDSNCYIDKN